MTVANGLNHLDDEPVSTVRRCVANVRAALKLLARPVRLRSVPPLPLTTRAFVIASRVAVAVLVILMTTIDAASIRGVDYLPRWLVSVLDEITD